MPTTIPNVHVGRIEAGNGHLVTCDRCPNFRTVRPTRPLADAVATQHLRSHGRPDPADLED